MVVLYISMYMFWSLFLLNICWNCDRKFYNISSLLKHMNILFVCNQNQNRSKTAEELFKCQFNTKSAGLYNQKPVTAKQISWADTIIVMEERQRSEISKRFPKHYIQKRILSLDIPDVYNYNNADLIKVLKSKMKEYSDILI